MRATATKEDARELIESLPEEFQWDDLIKLIADRIAIERGIEDVRAGRVTPVEEIRKSYGLDA